MSVFGQHVAHLFDVANNQVVCSNKNVFVLSLSIENKLCLPVPAVMVLSIVHPSLFNLMALISFVIDSSMTCAAPDFLAIALLSPVNFK